MARVHALSLLILGGIVVLSPVAPRAAGKAAAPQKLPVAEKRPVTDEYHGTKVTEDYRWLETWNDPKVQEWSETQNRYTRDVLDKLPDMPAIRKRVELLARNTSPGYGSLRSAGGVLFAVKDQPPRQQPYLVTLRSPDDLGSEHVVLDPNKLDPTGHTAIDFFVPSHDGRLVAVSLSQGGSELGTLRIYDVASGKELGDRIEHVNGGTAGGSVAWAVDGKGLYYTRYPRAGERADADLEFYQQVYYHALGRPTSQDSYSIGKDFPRIAEIELSGSDDGRWFLALVRNGDGGEVAFYLKPADGEWKTLSRFEDRVVSAKFGGDGALYLLSRMDAPRGKVLRLPLADADLSRASTIVPESDAAIQGASPIGAHLYVHDLLGGPAQVRVFDLSGTAQGTVPLPEICSVNGLLELANGTVMMNVGTFTTPAAWYRYAPGGKLSRTSLYRTSPADFSDCEVVRVFATSKDGTKVPLNILKKKGTRLDGNNPTLLYAYGGYGLSQTPGFNAGRRVWLEQGGVWVLANIRGGGEYGDQWHLDGNLTKKQNDYDDFAAAAKWLVDNGYTRKDKLAIEGGSNGGLLMGVALTQHPDYYRAVVARVGLYDMMRVELSPNGAFNVTEFGTVKDADQFKAMYAYSPYHHVVDGTSYPATMFMTGANDPRVDPANSRKMAARLQAANAGPHPVLLRTSSSSGHGIGSSLNEKIAQGEDAWGFLFHELGVKYKPVPDTLRRPEKGRGTPAGASAGASSAR